MRMLRKNPGFTTVAILTLALGIGVNTAIFTAFDALVLRPRQVKDPDRLASVSRTTPAWLRQHDSCWKYVGKIWERSKIVSDTWST